MLFSNSSLSDTFESVSKISLLIFVFILIRSFVLSEFSLSFLKKYCDKSVVKFCKQENSCVEICPIDG